MSSENLLPILLHLFVIAASCAVLFGLQRWIDRPMQGDERLAAAIERAREINRHVSQRSIEMLTAEYQGEMPSILLSEAPRVEK